jgi:hypothetical protein
VRWACTQAFCADEAGPGISAVGVLQNNEGSDEVLAFLTNPGALAAAHGGSGATKPLADLVLSHFKTLKQNSFFNVVHSMLSQHG